MDLTERSGDTEVSGDTGLSGAFQLRPWMSALALAIPLAAIYLLVSPPSGDLAAASYRGDLFSRFGPLLWENGWYAGHALPAYSLLSPPLSALLGVHLQLALCVIAGSALFGLLAQRGFAPSAANLAAASFALGLCVELISGRVAYDLGIALALATLLASGCGLTPAALLLALLTTLASPVAGAFLALAKLAQGASSLGGRGGAGRSLAIGAVALIPIGVLAIAFPEGGYEPFAPGAFWPALAGVVAIALLLRMLSADDARERWGEGETEGSRRRSSLIAALGWGSALYGLALVGSFAIHTPVGGNSARMGSLLAAPLLAGLLWERRRVLLALAAPALLYWQLAPSLDDLSAIVGEPSVSAWYFAPLEGELSRLDAGKPTRVEVPLMNSHWEASYLPGGELSLARGWDRQLDTRYAGIFYGRSLSPPAYRAWLYEEAVSYVALPDTSLDDAGRLEAALLRSGPPSFLRLRWRSTHWRLYEVLHPQPLAQAPAKLLALGIDSFELEVPHAGRYEVRVHFSPYWSLTSGRGCVSATGSDSWTEVSAFASGSIDVGIDFSLSRVFDHGARCN